MKSQEVIDYRLSLVIDADALEIPLIELVDTLLNLNGMMPSETMELIYVSEFLEGTIWF